MNQQTEQEKKSNKMIKFKCASCKHIQRCKDYLSTNAWICQNCKGQNLKEVENE